MYKHVQRSFGGGFLDETLMGRQDLQRYFTGSSELLNFRVRRQGCISKRRGTDFAADLSVVCGDWDGWEFKGIRIFPLVQSATDGLYLLFASYEEDGGTKRTHVYVASKDGVLCGSGSGGSENKSWKRDADSIRPGQDADGTHAYRAVMNDIGAAWVRDADMFQSGDTVFICRAGARPRRLVWDAGTQTLEFSAMSFSTRAFPDGAELVASGNVNPPQESFEAQGGFGDGATALTVTKTGWNAAQGKKVVRAVEFVPYRDPQTGLWTWWRSSLEEGESIATSTVGTKTVKYAVTVVRKGAESLLSEEKDVVYCLPWPQEGKVTLTVTGLATDGDDRVERVNFYKKESTGWGFIGREEPDDSGTATMTDDYLTPDMSITPPTADSPFNGPDDYPSCVGLFQQRLVFASSRTSPMGFWMSAVGDIYNFSPHDSYRADDAIVAELAAMRLPNINHVVASRDLLLLGDGGEWRIAPTGGNALTYKTVSATLQSQIGCSRRLKPLAVGHEVVFGERTRRGLRAIGYGYSSDGYETTDLTVLAQGLFRSATIEQMCYRQHPDDELVCVLSNGRIATLAYMREHEICAWSLHRPGGSWRAVGCAANEAETAGSSEVALVVERGNECQLWMMRPERDVYKAENALCMDGIRTMKASTLRDCYSNGGGNWPDGDGEARLVDLKTGRSVSQEDLEERDENGSYRIEDNDSLAVGYAFKARWRSVRPEPSGDTIQFELKNAKDMEVRVHMGGAWRAAAARPASLAPTPAYLWQKVDPGVAVGSDGLATLDTSDHRVLLSGDNSGDGRVEIESDDHWPLTLLQVATDYEVQPLSNSEG